MIQAYSDGGSRNNPGHAAWGFVVKVDNKIIYSEGGYMGIATNNIAEYTGLLKALIWLEENKKDESIEFFLDSNLIVSQLNGVFKVKNAAIRELVVKVREIEPSFKKISYTHIPREKNKEADELVNIALDKQMYGI